MKNKYYKLTIISDGALPNLVVDKKVLQSFEKSFNRKDAIIEFTDQEGKGKFRLRSQKIAGYKKAAVEFSPLMEGEFTPDAQELWDAILPEHKTLLLNKVWCPECRKATTMINISGTVQGKTLVLRGNCKRCSHKVARVVESD